MDGKLYVVLKTLRAAEFEEVESRTCASTFNVENDIINVALRCIIAKYSEISLPEKDKYCIFLPIYRI